MPNDKFLSVVTTFLLFVWVTKGFWRNLTWRVMLLMDPMMLWVQEPLFFDSCYTLRPFQQRAAMPLIGAPKDPCRTWGFWRGWGWVGLDGTLEMNLGVPTLRSQKLWFWQDGESILKSKTLPLHFWEAIAHFFYIWSMAMILKVPNINLEQNPETVMSSQGWVATWLGGWRW